jgi:S-DNA-T family DNA segregation ATPase FtsK/SpoIIIE
VTTHSDALGRVGDDADAVTLPDAWTAPERQPLPLAASLVPVLGAVVLWLVTGSPLSLLLAALGPILVAASMLDGARAARTQRRRADHAAAEARVRAESAILAGHDRMRRTLWARHPDLVASATRPTDIWRTGRPVELVLGAGRVAGGVRVIGGAGDPGTDALRSRAARLEGAPIRVAATRGVAVVGRGVAAAAVHRGLALQLCSALPPGRLRFIGPLGEGLEWAERLPHRRAATGLALALVGRDGAPPPDDAEIVLALAAPGQPLPRGCGVALTVSGLARARLDDGDDVADIAVEAVSLDQAVAISDALADRARSALGIDETPEPSIAFGALVASRAPVSVGALSTAVGSSGGVVTLIDLVEDGPHAVVAGVTGAGKSELLITWILALAATHTTAEVNFLLADFKGGTAFDALRDLRHVTGVITDLDGAGARRAMESLRAEVRWRESELARVGAKDIKDDRVELARLVIVVDELAAMLAEHPELHAVLADVAARGRALGMHLVLGTQRVAGVIRDGLLANCPLRISLRVTDAADSRAVIGDEAAAAIPGDASGRGVAFVRRGGDTAAQRTRIALTAPEDISSVLSRTSLQSSPRRPWMPELPARIELASLLPCDSGFVLGLADEPEHQRQRTASITLADRGLLVLGGPGSGKTTALEVIAGQAGAVVRVPATGEGAWDAIAMLAAEPPPRGTVVVVDDLDTLAGRVSPEHAQELIDRLERVVRGAGESGILVVAGAQRVGGAVSRVGELLRRRLILGTASRADHLAAGGDPAHYAPVVPPGRGRLDGLAVQIAVAPAGGAAAVPTTTTAWSPTAPLSGLVTRAPAALARVRDAWTAQGVRCVSLDAFADDPAVVAHGPVVVVGDPEEWQRHWRLLASLRGDHDLVVDVSCAADLRALTGSRALPPYAEPVGGRAWLVRAGAAPERIVLAASDERAVRPDDVLDRGRP